MTSREKGSTPYNIVNFEFAYGRAIDTVFFDPNFGVMADGWNSPNLNPEAYYEYRIVPAKGASLSLSEVRMDISLGRGEMRTAVYYSTDGFRSESLPLGRPVFFTTTTPRTLPLAAELTISFPDTFSIRVYAWSARDRQVVFNNRNISISAMAIGPQLLSEADIVPAPAEPTQIEAEPLKTQAVEDTPVGNDNGIMLAPMGSTVFNASGTFPVPPYVTCLIIECWGAGGGGSNRNGASGGGGGGAYTMGIIPYPGPTLNVTVGIGGSAGNGGGASNAGGIIANGGLSVINSRNGGAGGAASAIVGNVLSSFRGGIGGNARPDTWFGSNEGGGGGGGSAFNNAAGGNGGNATATGGTGGLGTGNGGRGADGDGSPDAVAGSAPGGGGGGRGEGNSTSRAGANGRVIITIPDYQAQFISMDVGSPTWCAGETRTVNVTVMNVGQATWTNASPEINIGIKWDAEPDYFVRTDANGLVPGASQTYYLTVTAPAAGVNHLTFDVVNEGNCWFAGNSGLCGPCNSVFTSTNLTIINSVPAQPATIVGPAAPCIGSTVNYSVTNVPGITYTWVVPVGWTITAGQGTNTITVTVGAAGGTFIVTPSNACGSGPANTRPIITTTVPVQPSAITGNINPCEGTTQNYSVINVAGVTYNWIFPAGWIQTGGGTTNAVTVTVGENSGMISVTPSNACGVGTAITLVVTVNPLPDPPTSITTPVNPVCVNAGGNITLTANGGSGTNVRWFTGSCGGTDIGTGTSLIIPSPLVTITYYARWENSCGISTCAGLTVTVIQLPVAPTGATVDRSGFCADDAGNITLTASGGSGTTLRWFTGSCGGTLIGSVNPLIIPSPNITTTYYARWENSCGVSSCAEVTVIVLPLPVAPLTASVDRNNLCYQDNGNIILSATGGSGDQMEWYSGSCGGVFSGTGNNLSIASPDVTTTYYVFWSNLCGSSLCQSITVTVNVVTSGSVATDQTICYGGNPVLFTSTINGTGFGTISYRWESSVSPFTVWNTIAGATGATYDPPAGLTETTQYRRTTISDYNSELCESDPTEVVTVTVQSIPTPGQIAEDQYVCFGGLTANIYSVQDGTGDGNITYRWERAVAPFTVWTTIAGATASGYNPGPLAFTTQFRRITVSTLNGVACESVESNYVTITIQNVAVTAGSIGDNQTICNGDSPLAIYSVVDGTATAGATVTYEWQINSGAWANIPGEFGEGLDISTPHIQTTQYRRRTVATLAGNSCYSNWTVAVIITVQNTVTPGSIAASQTICYNTVPAPLTSTLDGNSPGSTISYQWEQSTDNGVTWNVIGGATLAAYAPPALIQTTWYRRITVATVPGHQCFSIPTNIVIITVHNQVNPGSIAASQTICYGATPAPLTSVTPGSGSSAPAYTWQYSIDNGVIWIPIAGANAAGYAPGVLTQTTWFRRVTTCTLNGVSCSEPSAYIVITVQGQVIPPTASANQTICYNTAPALLNRTNASGGSGNFTYQWQSSVDNITFNNIAGQTGMTYQPPALTVTTYYRVSVNDVSCGGPFYSNVVTITVRGQLGAPVICCDQIICTGSSAEPITVITPPTGGSGSYSYQWEFSLDNVTWNIVAGAVLPFYTPSTDDRYYRLRITDNTCGTIIRSNVVHVYTAFSLSANFSVGVNPGGQLCPGSSLTVSIESGNITVTNKYIRYSWTANPAYIIPATGGPVGFTDCFLWIFCWHWADIPFTVINTTNATVTTDISVTPIVYFSDGTINCILPTETIPVTIRPFMLQCPVNMTTNTAPGLCTAQVAIPNIQWVANSCTNIVNWTMTGATIGAGAGNMGTRSFNLGVTTVTYTSNLNGQTTACSFTVTIVDNQPPVLVCPANISLPVLGGCSRVVNYAAPVVTDCSTYTITQIAGLPSGSAFPVGTTINTFQVTDASGNTSVCSFTVTITDTQAPVFTSCPSNLVVSTDAGECTATFDPVDPVVTDNCYALLAITWTMSGATTGSSPITGINFIGLTTFNPGITTIVYTATDPSGTSASCSFTITVNDTEPPQFLFCPSGYSVNTAPGSCSAIVATQNPEIFDNCGISSLTWIITGATTGNSVASGINYVGSFTFNSGTSTVSYTLTDSNTPPLSVQCSFDVTITDTQVPVITCPGDQTRNTTAGVCTYTAQGTEFDPTYSENCPGFSISNSLNGGPTLAGYVFPIGLTNILWIIIDASGNSTNCIFDVTVIDNQQPVITSCAPAQTANAGANCQAAVPDVTDLIVVTDNCTDPGDFTITQSPVAGTLAGVGVTTITITATDENGLWTSCLTTLTVTDNTAPVFADCPANPVDLPCNPATLPDAAMAITEAGTVTDNCGTPIVTASGGIITNTGCAYTQIWTVTASDGSNTANCVVTFNWTQDYIVPIITTSSTSGNLGCNPTVTAPIFSGTDNCEGTISPDVNTSGPSNTGCNYSQTWTATYTDVCGNNAVPVIITFSWTQDNEIPVITTTATSGDLGCSPAIVAPIFTGNDNCEGVITPVVTTAGPTNTGCNYSQTWISNYTDACNNAATPVSISFTWTQDTEQPVITTTASSGALIGCNPAVITPIYTGTDNCEGTITPVVNSAGPTSTGCDYSQTWTATYTDACGNAATPVSITYTWFQDTEAPVIDCGPGSITVAADAGETFASNVPVPIPAITDNCVGSITLSWTSSDASQGSGTGPFPAINIFQTGTTTITWAATDACGNESTCTFTVNVTANDPPDITCTADVTQNAAPGLCSAVVNPSEPSVNTGAPVTWSWEMTGAVTGAGTGPIDDYTFPVGTTTITWTATNTSGTDVCIQTITIVDNEPPVFVLTTTETQYCVNSLISASYNPDPLPGITPEYDDITTPRPEYYLLTAGNTNFDLDEVLNGFNDNCCAGDELQIHWRIDFSPTPDPSTIAHDPILWPPIPDQTGQPSEYGDIQFPGDGVYFTDIEHYLYYWLVDCHGNSSAEQMVTITITPRPNVIKQ